MEKNMWGGLFMKLVYFVIAFVVLSVVLSYVPFLATYAAPLALGVGLIASGVDWLKFASVNWANFGLKVVAFAVVLVVLMLVLSGLALTAAFVAGVSFGVAYLVAGAV